MIKTLTHNTIEITTTDGRVEWHTEGCVCTELNTNQGPRITHPEGSDVTQIAINSIRESIAGDEFETATQQIKNLMVAIYLRETDLSCCAITASE